MTENPSLQEWGLLYAAAEKFKQMAPWDWMHDGHLFGVKDPQTGQIGYACIMGNEGQHYALSLYLDTEGLESLLKIAQGPSSGFQIDPLFIQKCLMASFEDRKYLDKQDLKQINELNLKFRGTNTWPKFRNFEPGFFPWYLNGSQARFLTIALEQAMQVAKQFKNNPFLLPLPQTGQYLVRVPTKTENETTWKDEWLEPDPWIKQEPSANPVESTVLEQLKKPEVRHGGTWQVDFFHLASTVKEKDQRPYFPTICLIVEPNSGMILNMKMEKNAKDIAKIPNHLAETMQSLNTIPNEIQFKQTEMAFLLKPFATELNIKTVMTQRMPALENAQNSLNGFSQMF